MPCLLYVQKLYDEVAAITEVQAAHDKQISKVNTFHILQLVVVWGGGSAPSFDFYYMHKCDPAAT